MWTNEHIYTHTYATQRAGLASASGMLGLGHSRVPTAFLVVVHMFRQHQINGQTATSPVPAEDATSPAGSLPAATTRPAFLSIWGPFRPAWPELRHRLSLVVTCFGGSGTFHLSRELGPPGQVPLSACPITSHGSGHLAGLLVPPSRGVCSSDFLQTLHLAPGLPVSGRLPAPLAWSGWVHASEAGACPQKLMAGPREGGWNVRLLTSGARSRLSLTQGLQRDLLRPQSSFTHGLNL